MSRDVGQGLSVGDLVPVEIGPVAHGGHCVARHEGQVLFVRHALPGEQVLARVTELGPRGRYVRADAEQILQGAAGRVAPPCPYAGPGPSRCGGCDWQHADLATQRELKAAVVVEQFQRLAGMDVSAGLVCEPVPGGEPAGLRWRTRVEFAVDPDTGRVGLRAHRSRQVVPVQDCLIATREVLGTGVLSGPVEPGVAALDVIAPSLGEPVVVPLQAVPSQGQSRGAGSGSRGRGGRGADRRGTRHTLKPAGPVPEVSERVGDQEFTLSARGFWQVHPGAATTFTDQVMDWLEPRAGERALDLYAGVGLFAVPLAQRVGPEGRVLAVEADRRASLSSEQHLAPYAWADATCAPTERALADLVHQGEQVDLVVLDPPRSGAGRAVMEAIDALSPRAVVYVACDPAALARDTATARELGWELSDLRVLDAFPMTHHVECLARFEPARSRM